MTQQMITWLVITLAVALLLAVRVIMKIAKTHRHIIEIGDDRDIFYLPGDRKECDYDPFE